MVNGKLKRRSQVENNIKMYIDKKVQELLSGKKWIKLSAIWDLREHPYKGGKAPALIRRSGGVNVAIEGMRCPTRECDEFLMALEIINKVKEIKDASL